MYHYTKATEMGFQTTGLWLRNHIQVDKENNAVDALSIVASAPSLDALVIF